jgi:predicted GNAT family acetyltransferase
VWRVHGLRVRSAPAGYRADVSPEPLVITDVPVARRFEARRAGQLVGFIDYRRVAGRIVLAHTEVPPAFEGQGIASTMAREVLEGLRTRRERVAIKCPYLITYVQRHPELAPGPGDLIPEEGSAATA